MSAKALTPEELEALFDLGYHLKGVDGIFGRVFGEAVEFDHASFRILVLSLSRPRPELVEGRSSL